MLIGITGFKRSGKTTLAIMLSKELGIPVESFADPIRRAVADILGWSMEELEARKEDQIDWLGNVTPRHMMQTLGTEWGRHKIHPAMWIRRLTRKITPEGLITSDVRFDNEAIAIHEHGGIILRVIRPGLESIDKHVSERPIQQQYVTADVYNRGTPEDMLAAALKLLA